MLRIIADLVAPTLCVACDRPSDGALCEGCADRLRPLAGPGCVRCGHPWPGPVTSCAACTGLEGFDRARSLLAYRDPAGPLALALKRRGCRDLARDAGGLLADLARAHDLADRRTTVTFVPAGREGDRRGYDHAQMLARQVARSLGLPLASWLRRRGRGRRQSEVALERRRSNAAGRFGAVRAAGRVLLVDDVMTTGATVEACAEALRAAGADRVDVCTLARTLRLRRS